MSATFGGNLNPNLLNLKNVIPEPSSASSNLDHLLNFGRSIKESFAKLGGFKLLKPKVKPLRPSGNHGTLGNPGIPGNPGNPGILGNQGNPTTSKNIVHLDNTRTSSSVNPQNTRNSINLENNQGYVTANTNLVIEDNQIQQLRSTGLNITIWPQAKKTSNHGDRKYIKKFVETGTSIEESQISNHKHDLAIQQLQIKVQDPTMKLPMIKLNNSQSKFSIGIMVLGLTIFLVGFSLGLLDEVILIIKEGLIYYMSIILMATGFLLLIVGLGFGLYFRKCPKNILFATSVELMTLLCLLGIIISASFHLPYYPRIYIVIALLIFTVLSASETWGIVNSWICLFVLIWIFKFLFIGTVTAVVMVFYFSLGLNENISIEFW